MCTIERACLKKGRKIYIDTRSGESLRLGMPMAPQDNLRTPKCQSLGMPRKASPLSSTSIGNFTWSYIFTTWYVFSLERLLWFESLFVSLPQSSLLYTPFDRDTLDSEIVRILYVLHLYLLSYIVFALVLHLYLLEHGGGLFYRNYYSLILHLYYFESLKQHGNFLK